MSEYRIDENNSLYYVHNVPARPDGVTWVFFNALTGDTGMWESEIGPKLRSSGHGTLSFNYRGQSKSSFSPELALDADLIVSDTQQLLAEIAPSRPLLCGLSIGGLFASQSILAGLSDLEVVGLVLINTLRRNGQRLRWINDALVRCAEVGGLQLFRDLFVPLLFNEEWQSKNRDSFLLNQPYAPLDKADGHYNLLKNAASANWDQPYEKLDLPVLVITGLQDHVFLDLEDVAKLNDRLPNSKHIQMANAGHMIPAERPVELVENLMQFSKEVSP